MTGQSTAIDTLAKALTKAQAKFPNITGDGTGQAGGSRKYKYATLGHVIETVRPILADSGLCIVQTCEPSDAGTIRLTTTLIHESGQFMAGTAMLPLANNTPQGYGSAMTYARRYQYAAILGIATEDDDDGHEGSQQQAQPASRSQRGQQAPASSPAANSNGARPVNGFDALGYDKAGKEAIAYLGGKLKPKGYASTADVVREMKAANLPPATPIGVLIQKLPDLTGGGEPPAEGGAYQPSQDEIDFYGSAATAIEAHEREQQQAQQPVPTGAN